MVSEMNIGLDIDGTITAAPSFFSVISHALKKAGHKIYIITHRFVDEKTLQELKDYNIFFHDIFSPDSIEVSTVEKFDAWKGQKCRELNINIWFEDDPRSIKHAPVTTHVFRSIDLSDTIGPTFEEIEEESNNSIH